MFSYYPGGEIVLNGDRRVTASSCRRKYDIAMLVQDMYILLGELTFTCVYNYVAF